MRICAIGNSHIAALKLGWDEIRTDYDGVTIDFFGSGGQTINQIRCDDRRIMPGTDAVASNFKLTSGGRDTIEIDSYDQWLVVGGGLSLHAIVRLYARFRSDDHDRCGQYLLSPDAFRAAAWGVLERMATVHVWSTLRTAGCRNVTLVPNPLPGRGLLGVENGHHWRELARTGDGARLISVLESYLATLVSEGATVLMQPNSTRSHTIFTKQQYSTGYPTPTDDAHKNASYGIQLLRHWFERFNLKAAGRLRAL